MCCVVLFVLRVVNSTFPRMCVSVVCVTESPLHPRRCPSSFTR